MGLIKTRTIATIVASLALLAGSTGVAFADAQTIIFTGSSHPLGADFNIVASPSPVPAPMTFAVDGSSSGVCSLVSDDGNGDAVIHPITTGNCLINATQPAFTTGGDVVVSVPAASGSATFTITGIPQTITFGALTDQTFGTADFAVSATSTSGLPPTFGASGNCTVAGSTVHLTGVGSCSITANQTGDSAYSAASPITQSFTINAPASTLNTVVVHASDLDTTSSNPGVVALDGLNKWFAYDDTSDLINNALASFVAGPSSAPAGVGSVQFTATSSLYRGNIATYQFSGTALSSITSLAYSAYSHSGVAGANESPFLAFNVDFTGSSGAWQRRLVYVPADNGSVAQDAWNTNDAIQGGSARWEYSGATWPAPNAQPGTTPKTWSQILTDYPNARLLPAGGWLGVRTGEPGPAGYTANVDKFVIGIQSGPTITTTTYDFEPVIQACNSSTFDGFSYGSVNGQGGWAVSNPAFDQAVVANTYGFPTFGCKTLRISDKVTSGSFGDQTFSPALADEAGETTATTSGMAIMGTRKTHFEAQFDLASAMATLQPGMHLSVSPDNGSGARMSYLRFEDQADGIHVFFDDALNSAHTVNVGGFFNETDIATLNRTSPHTIKFSMDFVDGPDNDVVQIFIDGVLIHTGTSWEDYYRYATESQGENPALVNVSRTVDKLLFRESSTATPADAGQGFLLDNFSVVSSTPAPTPAPPPTPSTPPSGGGGGSNGPISGSLGGFGGGSVLGASTTTIPGGQVLGASTSTTPGTCSELITKIPLSMGRTNDISQVKALQTFLNGEMNSGLPVNGFFGPSTKSAVESFQQKYATDILAPWGLTSPTGIVFKTTAWKINMIHCPSLNLPVPTVK